MDTYQQGNKLGIILRSRFHLERFVQMDAWGLLANDVFSRVDGLYCHVGMQMRRGGDAHEVYVLVQ